MRNRTYGGVRGRKTKVGRKLLRFPPTRLSMLHYTKYCIYLTKAVQKKCRNFAPVKLT